MARLSVVESVTLDGVMQGLGRPDEDIRDGFTAGGWGPPYADEVMGREMGQGMATAAGMLLGRRTYDDFYGYWPHQPANPYTEVLNNIQKYVVTSTAAGPLPWINSTVLSGDPVRSVATLKDTLEEDLVTLGSGRLVRSLLAAGLVDTLVLLIHPLLLGQGRRLFPDRGNRAALTLVSTVPTSTGVLIATYEATPAFAL
jgi:dihydrofolate reductase